MKKIFASTIFIFFIILNLQATHNHGGEITVKQLSYLNYEATIHTYTVESSAPVDRDSLVICWGDNLCEYIVRDTSYNTGKEIICNTYTWQHTYSEEGIYTISMTDPNRTGGIINLPISDNVPFHIQTEIVVSTFYNNTPVFLNPPTDWGYINQNYQHNPAVIDWEGDSITYEVTIPLSGIDTDVSNYSFPDQAGSPNSIFSIDNELGTVNWNTPQIEGDFVVAIKVKEYRGGQVISTIIRDFIIPINENINQAPHISIPLSEVTLSVGDTLKFDVSGFDPEDGEILIQALGQPFLLDNPPSFNVPTDFTSGSINANFEWEIFDNHVYLNPYYLVFRIEEKDAINCGLTDYHILKININFSPTNIKSIKEELDVKIFPNPIANNNIFVKINDELKNEKASVQIISLDGKLILEKMINASNDIQSIDLQGITNGNYIFIINTQKRSNAFQIAISQ